MIVLHTIITAVYCNYTCIIIFYYAMQTFYSDTIYLHRVHGLGYVLFRLNLFATAQCHCNIIRRPQFMAVHAHNTKMNDDTNN